MAGECQHFGHMCGTLGLAAMGDISELRLSHASCAHTLTYMRVHECPCLHVHVGLLRVSVLVCT